MIQDGVYYVYAGRRPRPQGGQGPQGLVRYVPRPGKEVLVPYRDHRLDISGPVWGLNAQGAVLHRQGGEPALAARPDHGGRRPSSTRHPPSPRPVGPAGPPPLWETLLEDIHDTAYDAALFLDQVTEDTVTPHLPLHRRVHHRHPGAGQPHRRPPLQNPEPGGPVDPVLGGTGPLRWSSAPRTRRPGGSGWTFGRKGSPSCRRALWRRPPTAAFQGGPLAWYTDQGEGTGRVPTSCSPQAGGRILPARRPSREARTYLAAAQGWGTTPPGRKPAAGRPCGPGTWPQGRRFPLLERCNITGLVTDGTWCYCTNGGTTDCYRLDWDGQGRPTGLVLVESAL